MTANPEHLRELAEQCEIAAYRSNDEDSAATFLDIASHLLEMAGQYVPSISWASSSSTA